MPKYVSKTEIWYSFNSLQTELAMHKICGTRMNRSMRIRNKTFIFFLFVFFIHTQLDASIRRGMWVVRYALLDPASPEQIIDVSKRLSITDLYVQVRALGKFFFIDENAKLDLKHSDAYRNFITLQSLASKNQIRIHAWLNTLYIASLYPKDNNRTVHLHKKYLLRSAQDETLPTVDDLKKRGIEGYFTDPIDPYNLEVLQKEIRFLVTKLHVEGIHLDYFRLPDYTVSYSPGGRAAFILNHFYDPVTILNSIQNTEHLNLEYASFLHKNLEVLLQNIRRASGDAELTIAVKPNLKEAQHKYYQNWEYWVRQRFCDGVVLMNYNPDPIIFDSNLLEVKNRGLDSRITIGIATYNQENPEIVKRLAKVEQMGFAGLVLFSFNDLQTKYNLQQEISILGINSTLRQ